jgi:hypothetical protein
MYTFCFCDKRFHLFLLGHYFSALRFLFTYQVSGLVGANILGIAALSAIVFFSKAPPNTVDGLLHIGISRFTAGILFVLFSVVAANVFTTLTANLKLFSQRNYLILLVYCWLTCGLWQMGADFLDMGVTLALIIVLGYAWSRPGDKLSKSGAFDAGFISGLFFPFTSAVLFTPILLWVREVLDGVRITGILLPVFGMISSIFIGWSVCFLLDVNMPSAIYRQPILSKVSIDLPHFHLGMVPMGLLFLLSIPGFISYYTSVVLRVRNAFNILFLSFIITLIFSAIFPLIIPVFYGLALLSYAVIVTEGILQVRIPGLKLVYLLLILVTVPVLMLLYP